MKTYIAILRGINVGGKRKILMADLKEMFKELNFKDITTYIQSGNVIFNNDSDVTELELATTIKQAILEKYGFEVPVIVITSEEMAKAINDNPFYQEGVDINQLHLTFLKEEPSPDKIRDLDSFKEIEEDYFEIIGKSVFLHCQGKYHQSKFGNTFFEKKLNMIATTRNWKTVLKLLEISRSY